MARVPRLVVEGEPAVYHLVSRTALDGFPLGDVEKEHMVRLLKSLSGLFFVEVLGFSVLGNHVHIVVRARPGEGISDDDIRRRLVAFYGEEAGKTLGEGDLDALRARLGSVSSYMKEIKESFTRFYNQKHGRRGFFWGGRFKSVLVEDGDTLINVLAYVDLNAVRAGIVERPEEYRWCSLGYHIQAKNKDGFLSLDFGLASFGTMGPKARLLRYRKFVYEVGSLSTGKGASIDAEIVEQEEKRDFALRPADCFRYRTRYFTDSGVIGSKAFVAECYARFQDHFSCRSEKRPTAIRGIDGVYSLKRLRLSSA